jgi:hypothetical protein
LKALLPLWLPWIRKRFRVRPEIEKQLLKISPRQMDRRLKAQKTQRRRRIYGRTKPGYLLDRGLHEGDDREITSVASSFGAFAVRQEDSALPQDPGVPLTNKGLLKILCRVGGSRPR